MQVIGESISSLSLVANYRANDSFTSSIFQNMIDPSSCPEMIMLSSSVFMFDTISTAVKSGKLRFPFSKVFIEAISFRLIEKRFKVSLYKATMSFVDGLCFKLITCSLF